MNLENEIEAILEGKILPHWSEDQSPTFGMALLWAFLMLPFFWLAGTQDLWISLRLVMGGTLMLLFHAWFYKASLKLIMRSTTHCFKNLSPSAESSVEFMANDIAEWLNRIYSDGIHKTTKKVYKICLRLGGLGFVFALLCLILGHPVEFSLPGWLGEVPERWRYLFNISSILFEDSPVWADALSEPVVFAGRNVFLSEPLAWYLVLLVPSLLFFYALQIAFIGYRIYALGAFLHHYAFWQYEIIRTEKHPISDLCGLLVLACAFFAFSVFRGYLLLASALILLCLAPQSRWRGYLWGRSRSGTIYYLSGLVLYYAANLWLFLPVPGTRPLLQLVLNLVLQTAIVVIIYRETLIAKSMPKNLHYVIEEVEQKATHHAMRTRLLIGLQAVLYFGAVVLSLRFYILSQNNAEQAGNSFSFLLFFVALPFILFAGNYALKNRWVLQKKTLNLIKPLLPGLEKGKMEETLNHYYEGFSSPYLTINTIAMSSMIFLRFESYLVVPLEGLHVDGSELIWFQVFFGIVLFIGYTGLWVMFWTGTKGIHSAWHALTCFNQYLDEFGDARDVKVPAKETYMELANIFKKTAIISAISISLGYILLMVISRGVITFLLYFLVGAIFSKMYIGDVEKDYEKFLNFEKTRINH